MDNLFLLLFLSSIIALIAGLIKPSLFTRFLKERATRKGTAIFFGISVVVFFVLFGITTEPTTQTPQVVQKNKISEKTEVNNEQVTKTDDDEQEKNKATNKNAVAKTKSAPAKKQDSTSEESTTTPTQVKGTDNQNIVPAPSETVSQKNAVRSAKSYLDYSAFSHDGLVAQLEYGQFSPADSIYGVDNSGADWNEQAAKSAKSYMEYSAFSRGSLIEQLKYSKFTQAQAEYGANAVGL